MIRILMLFYALLLIVVAGYLFTHRKRQFLVFNMPSKDLAANMAVTATLLIICAIASVVAAFVGSKMVALIVIAFSLVFIFFFANSLTRVLNH
ncbi:hypothetical protein [Lacticaseibacillus zhaodongensis]|uniref:hypothetical protein n=1 Tax=Lacticaseibacillus zhaodongensis TaxID=2668065 RepID=UPI0012D346A2|nr:hypothetical protein [Lacticaseibacillus zhaodongensis]